MNIIAEEHYGTVQIRFIVSGREIAFAIVGGQNFGNTPRSLYFCRRNWIIGHFDSEAAMELSRFLRAWKIEIGFE